MSAQKLSNENNNNTSIPGNIDESSYHVIKLFLRKKYGPIKNNLIFYQIKTVDFEDSQINATHYIENVTPFIFFLEKNKSYQFKKNSTNNNNNVSDIERMRGNMSDSATPSLMQFPSGFKIIIFYIV